MMLPSFSAGWSRGGRNGQSLRTDFAALYRGDADGGDSVVAVMLTVVNVASLRSPEPKLSFRDSQLSESLLRSLEFVRLAKAALSGAFHFRSHRFSPSVDGICMMGLLFSGWASTLTIPLGSWVCQRL